MRGGVRPMSSLARGPYRLYHLLCTRSCPVSRTRTLTDAMHFLHDWPTLPLTWLRVTEATPPSKAVRVFHYRLL